MASIEELQAQLEQLDELDLIDDIPGTASELLMEQAVRADWVPGSAFKYLITSNGDLEFEDLRGDWHIIRGASGIDASDAERWIIEIGVWVEELAQQHQQPVNFHEIYTTHQRFRSLADNLMGVMGFHPRWWKPAQLKWLLFQRVEEIEGVVYLIAPPVPLLLRARSVEDAWMPPSRDPERAITRRAEMIAMLAGACGGDLSKANSLAGKVPYRELIDQLDAWQYFNLSKEQRKEIEFKKWSSQERTASRPPSTASRPPSTASRPPSTAKPTAKPAAAPAPIGTGFDALPPSPVLPKPRPRIRAREPGTDHLPPVEPKRRGPAKGTPPPPPEDRAPRPEPPPEPPES